jgi:eukaryotic-like serine/threonine-protein kinase
MPPAARRAEKGRLQSLHETEAERRASLAGSARQEFVEFSAAVRRAIVAAAPAAILTAREDPTWLVRIGDAELRMTSLTAHQPGTWGVPGRVAIDVVCSAAVALRIPQDRWGYGGQSHSLWFGDIQTEGRYGWYETAFMFSALMQRPSPTNPFSLTPGPEAARALGNSLADFQVAWPFTQLVAGNWGEFIDRWAEWFAAAAAGELRHPSSMPERPPAGSWRRPWAHVTTRSLWE